MENNKNKKKYYQYYKNNQYNDNKHKKYYYNKNKKNNKKDNIIINNDYIENDSYNNVLNVNEDLNYNEYNGLFKRENIIKDNYNIENNINNIDNNINMDNNLNNNYSNNNYNNSDIDLDNILVRRDSIKEDNNINSDNNIYNDVNNNYSDINNSYVEEPIKEENNINNDNVILDLDNILVKKDHSNEKEENKVSYDNLVNIEREEKEEKKSLIIRTKFGYALGVLIIVIALFGSTYAFFNYYKEDTRQADIQAGEVYVRVVENNLNLSLTKQYPRTKEEARGRNDNYIDFNLVGKNTSLTKVLSYKFTLLHGDDVNGKNRISDNYILFDLAELDSSNNETILLDGVTLSGFNSANISNFNIPVNQTTELQRKYRLRAWISEDVTISDDPSENATYTQTQFSNLFANFKVHVNSQDKVLNYGHDAVMKVVNNKIENNVCNPIWVDDMGTANDTSDDITYFSGTNDCVDMNYVWYSGKLWRITAIYPDGAMKLVTQNNITSIAFNESSVNFWTDANTTSYMYQWLNEDFYDTLYNASDFIDTTKRWNATKPANTTISTKPAETNMVSANVGLLNNYEYYNSYRCVSSAACTGSSYGTGYLNIGYYWWLLNPYDASYVWFVSYRGDTGGVGPTNAYGGRPSINLKSGVEFTGSGTKSDPYKIVGDKDTGKTNDLINTRLSGEYVKLVNNDSNQTFRIIGVEDGKTKIIAMDYADNKATKKFATSTGSANTLWGGGTTTGEGTWYTYLNTETTGYFDMLKNTYGNLFDSATYYLGTSSYNYKLSVCTNTTSGNTKVCTKTSQVGTFNIGLPRYGEMFATQQGTGRSDSIDMWLMNRYSASRVWVVSDSGGAGGGSPTFAGGGRPTVHLKSSVKIIRGTGTESDPYVVGL